MTEKTTKTVTSGKAPVKETQTSSMFDEKYLSKLEVTMEEMLKHGVHFGHQKSRKNPKMDPYIFTSKKGISIIDLQKTLEKLSEALAFIKKVKKANKKILIVGTKPQIKDIVEEAAKKCDMPFVTERWLGGTFTNFRVIRSRTKYLVEAQDQMERGEFKKYTKFERMKKVEELEKMEQRMGGIKHMTELPAAVFATSVKDDKIAIKEAHKMGIPVVAIADTNTNPTEVNHPIPANDDAISSVKLILAYVCKALNEEKVESK